MAKQIRINDELHEAINNQVSDTGVPLPIGATAERAIELYLKQRKLHALIMRAYRCKSVDDSRTVLDEVAEFLGIPKDYLLTD